MTQQVDPNQAQRIAQLQGVASILTLDLFKNDPGLFGERLRSYYRNALDNGDQEAVVLFEWISGAFKLPLTVAGDHS